MLSLKSLTPPEVGALLLVEAPDPRKPVQNSPQRPVPQGEEAS